VINDCGDFGVANVLEDVHGDDVVTVLIWCHDGGDEGDDYAGDCVCDDGDYNDNDNGQWMLLFLISLVTPLKRTGTWL
jgi:hypothetical protein